MSRVFEWVVWRLRPLAKVPGLPQFFDSLLLAWTCLAHRPRLAAMEALENRALKRGMRLRVHRFGGCEFVRGGRELGHLHGHGLLDVPVGPERLDRLIATGRVRRHHVFPQSWASFLIESVNDVPYALELLSGD